MYSLCLEELTNVNVSYQKKKIIKSNYQNIEEPVSDKPSKCPQKGKWEELAHLWVRKPSGSFSLILKSTGTEAGYKHQCSHAASFISPKYLGVQLQCRCHTTFGVLAQKHRSLSELWCCRPAPQHPPGRGQTWDHEGIFTSSPFCAVLPAAG